MKEKEEDGALGDEAVVKRERLRGSEFGVRAARCRAPCVEGRKKVGRGRGGVCRRIVRIYIYSKLIG